MNVTGATTQEAVTNKIDFSTGSYTVTEQSTSTEAKPDEKEEESSYFLPSIGGSVLDSLPPVLESGPWIERPIIPSWDDLEEEDKDGNKQAVTVEEDLDNSDSKSVNEEFIKMELKWHNGLTNETICCNRRRCNCAISKDFT